MVYRTNLSGENLAHLGGRSEYPEELYPDASPAALGLSANEYVTEFMASFGVVPSGFRQVEAPRVYCNVVSWITGGSKFQPRRTWAASITASGSWRLPRWVTTAYKPSEPLPRTGY